jgi:hypothetical protein
MITCSIRFRNRLLDDMELLRGREGHRLPHLVNLQRGSGDPAYWLKHLGQLPANDELRKVHSLHKKNPAETARASCPFSPVSAPSHPFKAVNYR